MHRADGLSKTELLEIDEVREIEEWALETYGEGILWPMITARLTHVDAQDFEKCEE